MYALKTPAPKILMFCFVLGQPGTPREPEDGNYLDIYYVGQFAHLHAYGTLIFNFLLLLLEREVMLADAFKNQSIDGGHRRMHYSI